MTHNKKLFVYKAALIAVTIVLTLFPSIADEMPQIDSRIMVTSIGLDAEKEKLSMTAAVTVPSGTSDKGKESVVTVSGISIGDLVNNLSLAIGKKVELAHCALVVMGKDLCERGIKNEVESLVSSGGISKGASLIAAKDRAKDFIEKAAKLNENAAFSLGSFISFAEENAQIPMITLIRFAGNCASVGLSAYLPIVEMSEEKSESESGGSGQKGSKSGDGGESESGQKGGNNAQIASYERSRIFKDYRAVGEFEETETRALTWLDPQADRGVVKLEDFIFDGVSLGSFTFDVRKKGIKVKANFNKDRPEIIVEINAEVESQANNRLAKVRQSGYDEKKLNKALIDELSEKIRQQLKGGLDKAIELKADPFKYGYRLYKKSPNRFRKAAESESVFFNSLSLVVKTNITLF